MPGASPPRPAAALTGRQAAAAKRELANLLQLARSEAAPGGSKTLPLAEAPAGARALLRSIAERLTQAHSRRMGQHEYALMQYVDSQQEPGIQLQGVAEPQSKLVYSRWVAGWRNVLAALCGWKAHDE